MLRVAEHLARQPLLHHGAVLHHGDEVADLRGDAQIMGDEDDGEPEPLTQFGEQFQHLRLHGNIQRRDRLVRDQHVRLQRQRARQPDALALAAGEFVRKPVAGGRIEADQREQFPGVGDRLRPRRAVHDRALRHQFGRLAARIERGERVLKHHLDMPRLAADIFARQLRPVLALEHDRSGVRIDQPHDAARQRRFARAGFADDAERRAPRQS